MDPKQLPTSADVDRIGRPTSPCTTRRFGIGVAIAVLVDLAVFQLVLRRGGGLAAAHLAAFAVAGAAFLALVRARPLRLTNVLWFPALGMMAAVLRGAAIDCAVSIGSLSPSLAHLIGIAVTAAVFYAGARSIEIADSAPEGSLTRWRAWAVAIFAFSLCMRLAYLGIVQLLPQEAYYWSYAQHPALSYLDHPPMVAWMIWLGTAICGDSEFGVRIGGFALSLLTAGWAIGLARNLYGRAAALGAVLVCGSFPFVVATGFFATPDAPLLAFWAGTLYFLERAILGERRRAWLGAGVCLGLGLLSKYTVVLLVPAVLLFLAFDRKSRSSLRRPDPYVAIALALLLFTPVLLWNAGNDWISFTFQGTRRMGTPVGNSLPQLLAFVILLLTPPGLVLAFRGILQKRADTGPDDPRKRRFLAMVTFVPLSVFVAYSLTHVAMRISWTVPIWLGAVPVMGNRLAILWRDSPRRWHTYFWKITTLASVVVIGTLLHTFALGVPGVALQNSMHWPAAWKEIAHEIDVVSARIERETGVQPLVVDADAYYVASSAAYYGRDTRDGVAFTCGSSILQHDGLMYAYWFRPEDWTGKPMLLVAVARGDLRDDRFADRFGTVSPIREQVVHFNGRIAGHLYYRVGLDYRPPDPAAVAALRCRTP